MIRSEPSEQCSLLFISPRGFFHFSLCILHVPCRFELAIFRGSTPLAPQLSIGNYIYLLYMVLLPTNLLLVTQGNKFPIGAHGEKPLGSFQTKYKYNFFIFIYKEKNLN